MEENKLNTENGGTRQSSDEVEIDLMEYVRKLWDARKPLLIAICVGIVVGLVVAFSIPKKYTVSVTLSPESGKSTSSSLTGMASMLGINSMNLGSDVDALNVILFPNIVSSTPFLLELFDVPVQTMKGDVDTTFLAYLDNVRKPWWGALFALPGKAIGGIKSIFSSEPEEDESVVNPFHLTEEQSMKVEFLRDAISVNSDKTTGVTTVSVTLQDPLVTAHIADVVITNLQEYITAYRVSKAQQDCEYLEDLYLDRQQEYYDAQQNYANYVDANKGVVLQSALTERERLQNEMNLAYQVYSQVSTQLQVARAKVQEAKPVFAVVEPATVPLKPSGMSKKVILLVFVFLAFVVEAVWILFCKDLWAKLKAGVGSSNGSSDETSEKKSRKFRRNKKGPSPDSGI